jgi:hypothetical protein
MHNLLSAEWIGAGLVRTAIGPLRLEGCGQGTLTVLLRPDAAVLGRQAGATTIEATLLSRSFRGTLTHITAQCASGLQLAFDLPAGAGLPESGQPIVLTLRCEAIVCLEEEETDGGPAR